MSENASEQDVVIKDKSLNFLICQTVICVVFVLFVLALKVFGGEFYEYSKEFFNENFDKPINVNQVLNANQAQKIIDIQSTVYGAGGTEEEIKYLKEKSELSKSEKNNVESSDLNSMCVPVSGEITSEYSYRVHPISGEYKFHSGLDVGADYGTNIKCALDGKVIKVDNQELTTYGKFIRVSHSNGVDTVYAHCSEIIASVGDVVKKGDVIAKVGSTGNSTGPHLHFEVRVNDVCLNPKWYADFVWNGI